MISSKEHGTGKPDESRLPGRSKCKWWDQVVSHATYVWNSVEITGDRERKKALLDADKSQLGHKYVMRLMYSTGGNIELIKCH